MRFAMDNPRKSDRLIDYLMRQELKAREEREASQSALALRW